MLSVVSLILSACQSGDIHKPVTASKDKLRRQAVRVPGTAVCGLPSSPLPPCPPDCFPSACLALSFLSPSPSSSPLSPPPTSLYLIVGLGAVVLRGSTFLVSSSILLPLEQKENWLPVVQHLLLQPGGRRGGKRGALHPPLHSRLPAPAVSVFSHFARNAFELLPDAIVCHANGVQRPAVIRRTVCKRRKEWSCIPTLKEHLKSAMYHDNLSSGPCFSAFLCTPSSLLSWVFRE